MHCTKTPLLGQELAGGSERHRRLALPNIASVHLRAHVCACAGPENGSPVLSCISARRVLYEHAAQRMADRADNASDLWEQDLGDAGESWQPATRSEAVVKRLERGEALHCSVQRGCTGGAHLGSWMGLHRGGQDETQEAVAVCSLLPGSPDGFLVGSTSIDCSSLAGDLIP